MTTAEAERQLAEARAEEATLKRENAKKEIKRLSGEGAVLKTEFQALAAQIKNAQDTRLRLNGMLRHAIEQIAAYSAALDPLDFPTAKDEYDRVEQLGLWQKRQSDLQAQHRDAVQRESVRPYAIRLQRRLEQLTYQIQNLTAIAEGRTPGQLEGGAFTVGEDFLGHSQVGPPRHM